MAHEQMLNSVYAIGQRDSLAGLFAEIRALGERAALVEAAKEYLELYGENPHVLWYLAEDAALTPL